MVVYFLLCLFKAVVCTVFFAKNLSNCFISVSFKIKHFGHNHSSTVEFVILHHLSSKDFKYPGWTYSKTVVWGIGRQVGWKTGLGFEILDNVFRMSQVAIKMGLRSKLEQLSAQCDYWRERLRWNIRTDVRLLNLIPVNCTIIYNVSGKF